MFRKTFRLLSQTVQTWQAHNAPRLGASLAFYALLSLAPLLIIAVGVSSLFFRQQDVQVRVVAEVGKLIGDEGADVARLLFTNAFNAYQLSDAILPSLIGLTALLFGASIVLNELREALNTIWDVKAPDEFRAGLMNFLKNRFISLTLAVGIGFLLLMALILGVALPAFSQFLSRQIFVTATLVDLFDITIRLVLVTFFCSLLYKYLPATRIKWKDTWIAAAITAILFSVGRWMIGLYLEHSALGSAYGAAGSLVIFLLWIYYSAQIFFFGAAFCRAYAELYGSRSLRYMAKAKRRTKGAAR